MSKLPPPMNLEGMNLEAIHEAIQDCHDWPERKHPDDAYHLGMRAVCTAMRLESALEAAQQEIADLKRGGVVVPELTACGCQYYAGDAEAGTAYREKCTKRHPCLRCVQRHNAELASRLRAIPADRELMRLVDELIRWHGLRPLDKRPDHAAVLVGAIKALRANQGAT